MKKLYNKTLLFAGIFLVDTQLFSQNNALSFDGIDDNVTIAHDASLNFSMSDSFSIESWFRTSSMGQTVIFSKVDDNGSYRGYDLTIQSGLVTFAFLDTYPGNCIWMQANTPVADGNWHHVVVVYKGIPNANNVDMYVDGIVQGTTITLNSLSGITTNTTDVTIGSRHGQFYFFNGEIDEVRLWRKALCSGEINTAKNCNLNGTENGLIAYYNFNDGSAGANNVGMTTLTDLTNNNPGILANFALTGSTSNWIASGSSINGICQPYAPISISGNLNICRGETAILTANGGVSYLWSNSLSGSLISVNPINTTNYGVTGITSEGCSKTTSVTVNVSDCTGIEQEKLNNEIRVYPNPTTGILNIEGEGRIELYNSIGKLIYFGQCEAIKTTVDMSNYSDGVYFIKLINNGNCLTKRVIKN